MTLKKQVPKNRNSGWQHIPKKYLNKNLYVKLLD